MEAEVSASLCRCAAPYRSLHAHWDSSLLVDNPALGPLGFGKFGVTASLLRNVKCGLAAIYSCACVLTYLCVSQVDDRSFDCNAQDASQRMKVVRLRFLQIPKGGGLSRESSLYAWCRILSFTIVQWLIHVFVLLTFVSDKSAYARF